MNIILPNISFVNHMDKKQNKGKWYNALDNYFIHNIMS